MLCKLVSRWAASEFEHSSFVNANFYSDFVVRNRMLHAVVRIEINIYSLIWQSL